MVPEHCSTCGRGRWAGLQPGSHLPPVVLLAGALAALCSARRARGSDVSGSAPRCQRANDRRSGRRNRSGRAAAPRRRPGDAAGSKGAARRGGGTGLRQLTPPARLTQGCGAQRLCEVAVVDAAGEVGVGHVAGEQALQVGGNCKEGPGAVLSGAPTRWPGAAQAAGSGGTARARAEPAWQARMRGSCGAAVPGRTGSTGCWGRGCRTPTGPGRARRWGCT